MAGLAALAVTLLAGMDQAHAAFTATTTNANTFAAAASFPTYPTSVTGDSPWAYHRSDDTASSAATSTAADSSGNARPGTYNGMTNGPSTYWPLDQSSGTVATDSSGSANPGTLGTGAAWTTTGRVDNALTLDGTANAYVDGAAPAVDSGQSFTVAAWAYLTDKTASHTVLSMGGNSGNEFCIKYSSSSDNWQFLVNRTEGGSSDIAVSTATTTANVWVHLVGVYNSAGPTVTLYVNGVANGSASHPATWTATGSLQVGRQRSGGGWSNPYLGSIDEVSTYRRALSASEISDLYGDNPSLQYDFEENTGTSVADRSGNVNAGTLAAAAGWTTSGHTGNALSLSVSATSYVSSASSPIDATQSFSISAWVNLNTTGAVTRTVVSQQGTNYDTFILKYESTGHWAFILMQNTSGTADQVLSTVSAAFNTWVHLVAVYDTAAAAGSKMKLYVNNGTPVVGAHATAYGTTNPLQIGRTHWGSGTWVDPWDGEIDELHTYQRALTTTEIAALYSPPATAAMTAGLPGALQGAQQGQTSSTAVAFNGTSNAYNNTLVASPGPAAFTIECWFKIASGDAGVLVGYDTVATGLGGSYDRIIYLDTSAKIRFGVNPGSTVTVVSPLSYDDATWHHVAASLGNAGMKLYIDGALVASNSGTTTAGSYAGYWRWGGTKVTGWPSRPNNGYLVGTLDEFAVYSSQLADQQIAWHYFANH